MSKKKDEWGSHVNRMWRRDKKVKLVDNREIVHQRKRASNYVEGTHGGYKDLFQQPYLYIQQHILPIILQN